MDWNALRHLCAMNDRVHSCIRKQKMLLDIILLFCNKTRIKFFKRFQIKSFGNFNLSFVEP